MNLRPAILTVLLTACAGTKDTADTAASTTSISAEDAAAAAVAITGGTASDAEAVSEDGHDLWEMEVTMSNGAAMEVLVFAADGALFEIKDTAGPFDYDTLDPLPGKLTYAEARAIAQGVVEGEQQAWEVKYTDDGYFYEFYQLEVGDQLWEIKLWADSGEVYVTEPVEAQD